MTISEVKKCREGLITQKEEWQDTINSWKVEPNLSLKGDIKKGKARVRDLDFAISILDKLIAGELKEVGK